MTEEAMHTSTKQQGTRTIRNSLATAIALALGMGAGAMPAALHAQTTAESTDRILEEVVVTAQRREQALQDVPMAISAFTGEELAALQADNLDSLQGAVPNMNLVQGRGSNSSVNAFIRGVGQPDALQTFDPAVGVYVDDVYMARIQGALFKIYDIERIEVLRGPQGTLYGKNTPAGAIRLVTRTPGQEFEAQAGLLVGDYSRVQARGYISGPLSDSFAVGLSVLHDERDGFVTDPVTGKEYNDEDTTVARLKANWDISADVNVVFAADYTTEDVAMTLGRAEAPLIATDLALGPVVLQPAPTGDWNFETPTNMDPSDGQEVENSGASMTVNWEFGQSTALKSITAFRGLDADLFIDIDASSFSLGDVFVGVDQDQFSQEFQLLGSSANVEWVAGLYYLDEDISSHQDAWADDWLRFATLPINALRTVDDDLQTKSYAAFGQADWNFAEAWTLGLGLRYTKEEKDYFRTTSLFTNLLGTFDPQFFFNDSGSWDSWTPTFTLNYDLTEDVRLYGRLAKGFKSGGFNGRANSAADVSAFDPEEVWTGELGAKTTMAEGRLQANYTVFMSKYDDFQARISEGDGLNFRFPVLNAAELDIKGAEVELNWLATESLQLSTQIGYLDSEYGAGGFSGSDGVFDEPAFSPEWTARFAGIYSFNLAGGSTIQLAADANYRDSMWLSVENVAPLTEGDYWLFNGFVSWMSPEQTWTVMAGIKNATDELYKVEGQEFRSVANIQTAYYGDPQTWTLSLEYRY
jgi:iron complex outermembrane receptor protein